MRLLQIGNDAGERRLGQIEGQELVLIEPYRSVYELAQAALAAGSGLDETARGHLSNSRLDYDGITRAVLTGVSCRRPTIRTSLPAVWSAAQD